MEKIRERHEQGFLTSLEFLKAILEVARDVVEAEREVDLEGETSYRPGALRSGLCLHSAVLLTYRAFCRPKHRN
ncbi:MAG: hypothetical protein M0P69_11580 [Bacteroidales bacterium]|nr:hypothetical protein [Bacteroidales bacterium]